MSRLRGAASAATRRLLSDLRTDRYLKYILLAVVLLAGFYFWHRIPNFATWDEHNRVLDPLVAYSSVLSNPTPVGIHEGVSWGRAPFGATFYVYAIAVLPVVLAAVLSGNVEAITGIGFPADTYAHYPVWASTPEWVWTWSLLFVRLTNVLFAAVTVYLVYRLGTELRNRWTGRVAAVLLTVTFGFLKLAKEGGEDIPATMCLVLTLLYLLRYLRTGHRRQFYLASVAGGVAIAFKLTVAPLVLLFVLAFALSARTEEGTWREVLWEPRFLLKGAGIGAVTILLGFPTALVGHIDLVAIRIGGGAGRTGTAVGPTAPLWWWFLRTYVSAFGWPLLVGTAGGVVGAVATLRRLAPETLRTPAPEFDERLLLVAVLGCFWLLFSTFHDFRVHHLLPTVPVLMVLLADWLWLLRDRRRQVGRVLTAGLVVSSALYAGVGVGMYASMPRDEATEWLSENADEDATMETYYHGFLENAIPHDMRINPIWRGMDDPAVEACPTYIQVGYKELLYLQDIPDDQRGYDIDSRVDERARYIRALLDSEYNYEIVAEFGDRPPNFVPSRAEPGSLRDLVPLGINPHSDQYGDEQELRVNQYVAILEHSGSCVADRTPPW
ncbi:dolichyl-phosphate-mannose--protein mannosyltransferase [Halovenus sp. WSH3]|uniref:Dolichyl-phosphate-mannose--protein mannosyltransferase n=1 Tax=Halovenus carboxidivorans TaxID=2692199 RepID=A0A6B0T3U9_9EURY|nr:glycosyltransferase family 39 protein [Halovenus carboxidivorans]MXR51717.1 dolichyl-phosphate-mannose--protein mannosyltransferase [Halovenus carboxidivorans]